MHRRKRISESSAQASACCSCNKVIVSHMEGGRDVEFHPSGRMTIAIILAHKQKYFLLAQGIFVLKPINYKLCFHPLSQKFKFG